MSKEARRIFIWSYPRTAAAALGKCLSNVDGVLYWHDPYGNCLNQEMMESIDVATLSPTLQEYHAKVMEVADSPESHAFFEGSNSLSADNFTYENVQKMLEENVGDKKIVIIKDAAMGIVNNEQYLPKVATRHVFLIRHPLRAVDSFCKATQRMCQWIGYGEFDFELLTDTPASLDKYMRQEYCNTLWKHVRDQNKDETMIVDSEDLVNHPDKILPELFKFSGLSYKESNLEWPADEEILKSWKSSLPSMAASRALKFHDRAYKSSGFIGHDNPLPQKDELPKAMVEYIDTLMEGYNEMYACRVQP